METPVLAPKLKKQNRAMPAVNLTFQQQGSDDSKPCVKRGRYISAQVKRIVFQRAAGRCEHLHQESGKRCDSRHQLEFDHRKAFSQGGSNEETNIFLLCRAHNNYRTRETHGFWYIKKRYSKFLWPDGNGFSEEPSLWH